MPLTLPALVAIHRSQYPAPIPGPNSNPSMSSTPNPNSSFGKDLTNSNLHPPRYAKRATGVKYAVYYSDYQGIQDADVSKQRFDVSIGRFDLSLNCINFYLLISDFLLEL